MTRSADVQARRALVVGIGNRFRGDDAAGLEAADLVHRAGIDGVTVQTGAGDAASLIESWNGFDFVVLVDAVEAGGHHGSVLRFDALQEEIPRPFTAHLSSHGVGVPEAIDLARTLDRLPPQLVVYGIVGATFDVGADLSPEVRRAALETAERIIEDIQAYLGHR